MNVRAGRPPKRWMRPWVRSGGVLLGLLGGLVACHDIQPVAPASEPITDPAELYTKLTFDYPAVNLSTVSGYNSLQLTATPRDALGHPMSGLPAPTFRSSDTTTIQVTAGGLITALKAGTGVKVIATLTAGPVTHVDTTLINVTASATLPKLASLSIAPLPPDSVVLSMPPAVGYSGEVILASNLLASAADYNPIYTGYAVANFVVPPLRPRASDTAGNAIDLGNFQVEYASLDPEIVQVGRRNGGLTLVVPGQARLVARTMAYGVEAADTVAFTVTLPFAMTTWIRMGTSRTPALVTPEVRIPPYGYVGWMSQLDGDSVDITFDDPTNVLTPPTALCTAMASYLVDISSFLFAVPYDSTTSTPCGMGNVLVPPQFPPSLFGSDYDPFRQYFSAQFRQFPVPGTYPYHSTRIGASGRVVVTAHPFAD